jgi:hypothetical protein
MRSSVVRDIFVAGRESMVAAGVVTSIALRASVVIRTVFSRMCVMIVKVVAAGNEPADDASKYRDLHAEFGYVYITCTRSKQI